MAYIDAHCHVEYLLERERLGSSSWAGYLARHRMPAGFRGAITSFCDPAAFSASLGAMPELLREPTALWAALGLHPHSARHYDDAFEARLRAALAAHAGRAVAVGEIGLDAGPHAQSPLQTQAQAFARQTRLATRELFLPVVVHSRRAPAETAAVLREAAPADARVHMHGFSDGAADARALLADFPNLCVGFTGSVAGRAEHDPKVAGAVAAVPLDRILLETDAPYMPINAAAGGRNRRGRNSSPADILLIAEAIARIKGVSADAVLAAAFANTLRLYRIEV